MSSKKTPLMVLLALLLLGGCALADPEHAFPEPPISHRWQGANPPVPL